MRKRNLCKKVTAIILVAALSISSAITGIVSETLQAEAASFYKNANLLVNPDFEDSKAFSPAGGSHVGNWFSWQSSSKATGDAQSGNGYAKFTGGDSALEQDLDGATLIPGMTYVYTVWAKVSGSPKSEHIIGVKNYGGAEVKQQVTSTEWEKYEIEFVYIEGNPRVYGYVGLYNNQHDGIDLYIDNASVVAKSDVESVSIENGKMTVKFVDSYEGIPAADDLSANYTIGQGEPNAIIWTNAEWEPSTKTAVLTFVKIPEIAVEQQVSVNLSYVGAKIVLDFKVEANGEEVVVAKLASVDAENGKITVALDKTPTVAPVEDDFTFEYKVDDGSYKALVVDNFAYSAADREVTVDFSKIRGTEVKEVTVKITYQGTSMEDTFASEVSEANTYYVDSSKGNDDNDGLSEDKAFASIDKLNTITFLPGDKILFKKGETFVGCFKPQGSGTKAAPITIGSYGAGDKRPVLQPGEDWQVSHIMSADAMHPGVGGTTTAPYVNYVIQFHNVAFWEVSDLEIYDPTPQTKNDFTATYCSGITIQGEDIGVLEHFYIDNVIIHGFHGPGTNLGKTSGGITMNVITNKERDRSRSVPTQINDIRITNCEIYDVGRSGINFLTPWARRSEGKWAGNYGTGRVGYEWLPYEDFYLGNNYIHDVDGDGCIVDNCANAVVENNLVTRCVTHLHSSARMAVGLFNWNSDDTYFQFNEVYDIQIGGTEAYNDGQGIEIDALNDRTWVQYNYVHDNRGGFMMFCTVGDAIRGYDYVVRYNISQNDYAHPRQGIFDVYADSYNGKIYNNTMYLTERALKNDQIFLFATAQSAGPNDLKMYNNIFYYDGEKPKAANQFGNGAIDWQSNIFYGFTNLPENDNPAAPNLSVDPMLADPGKGGTGSWNNGVITKVDLSCYELLEGSPAINAGVPLADNGGRDYFGNEVAGVPDIGAYESGSIVLKAASADGSIIVSDEEKTVSIPETMKITVAELLDIIVCDKGISEKVQCSRGELASEAEIYEGDEVVISYNGEELTYKVVLVEDPEKRVIPIEYLKATAGSAQEGNSSEGPASFAIDNNLGTMWHTDWDGSDRADQWIQFELTEEYVVDGLRYLPRSSGKNGIITEYKIQTSNDGASWKDAATGNWAADSSWKEASFEGEIVKYVRLQTVNAVSDQAVGFASALEIRLLGEQQGAETPEPPVTEDTRPIVIPEVKEEVCKIYPDVIHGEWYEAAVQYVHDNGIMTGSNGLFKPDGEDGKLRRQQFVTILWRMEDSPKAETDKAIKDLQDINGDEWYIDALCWAYENGVVTGVGGTMFKGNDPITRQQLATMMYRYAGKMGYDTSKTADYSNMPGADEVESYAAEAMEWAVGSGIISGSGADKALNPAAGATRAQIATIIQRFCEENNL